MSPMNRSRAFRACGLACLAVVLALGLGSRPAAGQVTTGSLSGLVIDQTAAPVPGATITAVHTPTGTVYTTVTGPDGRFSIPNVRVGGPYTVSASLTGFEEQIQSDVAALLGQDTHLTYRLEVATVSESVTVQAETSAIISPDRSGTASSVSAEAIENLPTLSRNLNDFARLSPFVSTNAGRGGLVVAGRSMRYNNIQIDGSVNNDLFGLADSGTPGGQAETQPISLDAIQEIQVVVAPYDVRQGGFSGGGINAVTRSGANTFQGTAYYFFRNQGFVSDRDGKPVSNFSDKQLGASLGGPILRDRVFFFVNADLGRKDQPSGWSVNGSGENFGRTAEAQQFRDILQSEYGYDPGGLDEVTRATNNDKVFVRLDWNISARHQLTVRHNYVSAFNDQGFPGSSTYWYPNAFYQFRDKTNSTVLQLNSRFGSTSYNELRLAYQTISDRRNGIGDRFPAVRVALSDGSNLLAGTEAFSTANSLDQDIVEITDNLTIVRGKHQITLGTHNELFKFDNLFIQNNFGSYYFDSLDRLAEGLAQQYDYSFSATSDPKQSARFKVNQVGFYVGDMWKATPELTLTLGLRWDRPFFPDTPTYNPFIEERLGIRNDVTPRSSLWQPRLGFNYDVGGNMRQQVRGGVGIFAGRTPYVWLSNGYVNNGLLLNNLSVRRNSANRVPFVADPDSQPTNIGGITGSASTAFDVTNRDFRFPQLLRTNVGYDRQLGVLGLVGTVELLYAKTLKDIRYEQLNIAPTGGTAFDGRPLYERIDPAVSAAYSLTNTDEGSQWNAAFKLERPFRDGFYASASYLYGRAKSVNDGTSSRATSNWGYNPSTGNPNDPPLAFSNFDVRHRINVAVSYNLKLGAADATLSAFYNGQSGRPSSTIFSSSGRDINGDGRFDNDLMYVPASADEVVVHGGTWADLDAYIQGDDGLRSHRGEIVPRNASRLPWINTLDLRLAVGIPIQRYRVDVTLDVLNLFASEFAEPAFPGLGPVRYDGIDADSGKPVYTLLFTSPSFQPYDVNDLLSRRQAQLGLRFRF